MDATKKGSKTIIAQYLLLASTVIFLLTSCVTTAKQGCTDEVKSRYPNYTEEERLTLFYGAKGKGCIHEWFLKVVKKDKDDPGSVEIDYKKIKLDNILAVERKQRDDLRDILDTNPKNKDTYRLLEEMGLRPYFEAEERSLTFRTVRLELLLNYNEFRKLLGEIDDSRESDRRRKSYTARIFLPTFDPDRDTPFTAKYVETAKQDNKLALIGKTTIFDYERLGKKETDPEFPYDPNRFLWKERVEGLEISIYKLMNHNNPRDKNPSYLEATRIVQNFDKNGILISTVRESKPALRLFASPKETLDIVVLDTDQEGDLGFGLPDVVEKLVSGIETGKDIYLQHQSLIARLFEEKLKDKRKPLPPDKPQKLEIAVAGTKVDPWEKNPSTKGWSIPHEYKSEKKDNYKIEIVFKPKKVDDVSSVRQIDYIAKIYYSATDSWQSVKGEVIEYYLPLSPFNEKDILEIKIDYSNKRKITIEREGYPSVSGVVSPGKNGFIGDRPVAVDFSDGEMRWRIADRDKNGVFMYRMEISKSSGSNSGSDNSSSSYGN